MVSETSVNDGEWHTVRFARDTVKGKLYIDDILVKEGEAKGSTKTINVVPPFYLGGINPKISNLIKYNLMVSFEWK